MSSEAHQKVTASHLRRNAYLYVRRSAAYDTLAWRHRRGGCRDADGNQVTQGTA